MSADSEEILVVVSLPEVELAAGTSPEARAAARNARIDRFREETREERVRIAREAERRFRRKVAWGARCSDEEKVFTTISVPKPMLSAEKENMPPVMAAVGSMPDRRFLPW